MSITEMSRVWKESKSKGNRLLLELALADYSDDDGLCFPAHPPSQARIAKKIRTSKRTAIRMIEAMELDDDLLIRQRPGSCNLYCILVGCDDKERKRRGDNLARVGGDTAMASMGSHSSVTGTGDTAMSQNPSVPSSPSKELRSRRKNGRKPMLEESDWTTLILHNSFGMTYDDACNSSAMVGRVHQILIALNKEDVTLSELRQVYRAHGDAMRESNGKLKPLQRPETIAAQVVQARIDRATANVAPAYTEYGKARQIAPVEVKSLDYEDEAPVYTEYGRARQREAREAREREKAAKQ